MNAPGWMVKTDHPDSASVMTLLGWIEEGIALRRDFDRAHPWSEERDMVVGRIAQLQYGCLDRLSAEVAEDHKTDLMPLTTSLSEMLGHSIRRDDDYVTELLSSHDLASGEGVARCDSFHVDLQWRQFLSAYIENQPEPDRAYAVKNRLDHFIRLLDKARPSLCMVDSDPACGEISRLQDECRKLEAEYVSRRISDEVSQNLEFSQPADLWNRRFQLARLEFDRLQLQHQPTENSHPVAFNERMEELATRAEEKLMALPKDAQRTQCKELLLAAQEESNDALTLAEDVPLRVGVAILHDTTAHLKRLASSLAQAEKQARGTKKDRPLRSARYVRRLASRTRNELQEKKLSYRLERLLGRRLVTWMENTSLLLILVLTGLIFLEVFLHRWGWLTDATRALLAWSDLTICSFFLGEFALKLSMAEDRQRYFRRHFLVGFLASVPFGFLAYQAGRWESLGDEVGLLRLFRFLRLPQLSRYIRLAQPLIRVGRLVFFLAKTTDRLVRRNANVFNRNIVLFDAETVDYNEPSYRTRFARLQEHFLLRVRVLERELADEGQVRRVSLSLGDLRTRLGYLPTTAVQEPVRRTTLGRDISATEVVRELVEMTPERLVQRMGPLFPEVVARYVRIFDLPIVRRLPVLRELIAQRDRGSGQLAALAANYLGFALQWLLNLGYFFADLVGTISGPIFLDRVGTLLVKATATNAKRLFTIGGAVLVLYALVWMARIGWLEWLTHRVETAFGRPVIILGVVCLAIMFIGNWLRRIANQASELGERLVEAQFVAQTKTFKERFTNSDLRFLADRVVEPELLLRESDDSLSRSDADVGNPESIVSLIHRHRGTRVEEAFRKLAAVRSDRDRAIALDEEKLFLRIVALLHRDFCDSGMFRSGDMKMTTQFLGNLAIANLRRSRGTHSTDEERSIRSLARSSAGAIAGPYLWFNYVTHIVTDETAKMLLDYNRHAIPLARLCTASKEVRDGYRAWLGGRLGVEPVGVPLPAAVGDWAGEPSVAMRPKGSDRENELLETVDFTAIDFLSEDPGRDEEIAQKYGPRLLELLQRDRRRIVRRAFRSYPLHRIPAALRTINPFALYLDYVAGARFLLLPLYVLGWILKSIIQFFGRVWRTARQLLSGHLEENEESDDSFAVAIRKIHRMRKPGFMASLWTRARFDVEYLGLALPGLPLTVSGGTQIEDDLLFIGASRRERIAVEQLVSQQRRRIDLMAPILRARGFDLFSLTPFLDRNFPQFQNRSAEVLRALCMAWIADYKNIYSLSASIDGIQKMAEHALRVEADLSTLPEQLPDSVLIACRKHPRASRKRSNIENVLFWVKGKDLTGSQKQAVVSYLRTHWTTARDWIGMIQTYASAATADDVFREIIHDVVGRSDLWSDQIVVLRTQQSLTVLDVYHYSRMVWNLGGYGTRNNTEFPQKLPSSFTSLEDAELEGTRIMGLNA